MLVRTEHARTSSLFRNQVFIFFTSFLCVLFRTSRCTVVFFPENFVIRNYNYIRNFVTSETQELGSLIIWKTWHKEFLTTRKFDRWNFDDGSNGTGTFIIQGFERFSCLSDELGKSAGLEVLENREVDREDRFKWHLYTQRSFFSY